VSAVIELDPSAFAGVLAGVREIPINTLFVQSVLCGHVAGRIYADDPHEPRALYAVHPYGMALLWGQAGRGRWLEWLHDYLVVPHRPTEWLQVFPHTWIETVEAALRDRLVAANSPDEHAAGALACTRVNFAFDREAYARGRAHLATAIGSVRIVPTTVEMFSRIEGSVVPKRFWRDAAQFIRHGGGFTAIVDGELAATAFCSFRHGRQFELGIETVAPQRGKGHARLVACALIDDCLRRGLEPVWACRLENAGSFQLALKLGFAPTTRVPYYRLP
jgi:RimJ/RimL family protein N-acetyltransferase